MDATVKLYPRHIRRRVDEALKDTPVVCLLGPRQCGKTTLARTFERPYVTLDDEGLLATALHDPMGFAAALPDLVTIDEVQRAPELFRAIKALVDRDRRPGRFLLTGSANLLLLPQLSDSLAGRMEVIGLQTLSEAEKERSPGSFLESFLRGSLKPEIIGQKESMVSTSPERFLRGGYPEPFVRAPHRARPWYRNYIKAIVERDIKDVARVRDAHELTRLLELLSYRNAELLNISNLGSDLQLDRKTIEHYLSILERLFLIRRLPSWHRAEAKRLIKAPKIHLFDSGLAATLSGLSVDDWLHRRDRFGHLLEAFVVQQLMTQAGWSGFDLQFWHYRDKDGVEVDVVITQGNLIWGIEVKASSNVTSADGVGLGSLAERCGKYFQGGAIFYTGENVLPMADRRFLAVPLHKLWTI